MQCKLHCTALHCMHSRFLFTSSKSIFSLQIVENSCNNYSIWSSIYLYHSGINFKTRTILWKFQLLSTKYFIQLNVFIKRQVEFYLSRNLCNLIVSVTLCTIHSLMHVLEEAHVRVYLWVQVTQECPIPACWVTLGYFAHIIRVGDDPCDVTTAIEGVPCWVFPD